MVTRQHLLCLASFLLLQNLPGTLAHGHAPVNVTTNVPMEIGHANKLPGVDRPMVMKDMEDFPDHPTYFLHREHSALMLAHIALMVMTWVVVLPLGMSKAVKFRSTS